MENMEYVRRLLEHKQPGFAALLELAASLVEQKLGEPAPRNIIASDGFKGDAEGTGQRPEPVLRQHTWSAGG